MDGSQLLGQLPSLLLGIGQKRFLMEEGANAVEVLASGWMEPAEEANAVEILRENVLEEAADQFERFEVEVAALAGGAVAVRPAEAAVGEEGQGAVGRGGLEDVTAQILEGGLSGTDGMDVDDPALFPEASRECGQGVGSFPVQGLVEEGAKMIGQRSFGEEELGAFGEPLALIWGEAAAGDEVVEVRMIDEGAAPGVEEGEHAEADAEAFGVGGQVLQSAGRGSKQEGIGELGMSTDPGAQRLRDGEGDQEIGNGQEQLGMVLEPGLGIGLAALGTVPVVAGVVGVVVNAAIRAKKERAPLGGGATGEDLVQDLALTGGHGRAVPVQVSGSPTDQHLMEGQGLCQARRRRRAHGRGLEIGHELIQALLMGGLGETGEVGVDRRGHGASVAEVDLDLAQVLPLLKKMGRVTVAQAVDVAVLFEAALAQSQAEGALEGAAMERLGGGGGPLAVMAFGREEEPRVAVGLPQLPEQVEGALGQGDVTVAVAFTAADVDEHPLGIDVADLQVDAFTQAQAAGVDGAQADAVIQGWDAREDLADFLGREDDREFELGIGADQLQLVGPIAVEGLFPEQLDGADGLGGGLTGDLLFGFEVDAILANLLRGDAVWGFVAVFAELADASQVGLLGARTDREQFEVVHERF